MILESIQLKNYRQYRSVSIEIPRPNDKGHITVIVGRMGYGKTNILNAINWCLYGVEPHLGLARKALPILNSVTKASMRPGDHEEVAVGLVFLDEGKKTEITRMARFVITANGRLDREMIDGRDTKLTVSYVRDRDCEYYQYPELYIERVMPNVLSSYFMFDGEKLDKYFLEETVSKIRGAIHGISMLDLFDKVVERLENTKQGFEREYRDPTPQMTRQQETIKSIGTEISDREARLKQIEEDESKLSRIRSDLDSALRSSSIEVVREKQKRREILERRQEEKNSSLQQLQDEWEKLIIGSFALAVAGDSIEKALENIAKVQKEGVLPAPYRTTFLQYLISQRECICGRKIEPDSNEEKILHEKMQSNLARETASEQLPLLVSDLHHSRSERDDTLTQMTSLAGRIEETRTEIEAIGKELEQIHKDIGDFDNIDIIALEKRALEVRRQLEGLAQERITLNAKISELRRQLDETEKALDKHRRSIAAYEETNRRKDLCQESLGVGRRISDEVLDSIRVQVDKITAETGLRAINDPKIVSVSIGQDFTPSVKAKGYEREEGIGGLSAGQRACLALAFLHALNSVSVWETPIVIDTPLGRIDLNDREPLLNVLGKQMKDKQIIMLVTSAEYTSREREALQPVILAEYEIARDEDGTAEVVKSNGS